MSGGWILGFDTATRATAVALVDGEDSALQARDDPDPGDRPRHAARLLPLCSKLLEQAGIGFRDLDRLAVGVGPGTFTGLRIGVATARALAHAAARPLVGVSTLQALAVEGLGDREGSGAATVLAVLDARRGEAFAAAWRIATGDGRPDAVLAPAALSPESLADRAKGLESPVLAVGEGAVEFRQILERSGAFVPDDEAALHRVSAAVHCRIASQLPGADPDDVAPLYLRLPDAEIALRAAGKP